MNAIPVESATTSAAAPVEQPKLPKKPRVAAQPADVAPSKARSAHEATPAKKANRGATVGKVAQEDSQCPPGKQDREGPGVCSNAPAALA